MNRERDSPKSWLAKIIEKPSWIFNPYARKPQDELPAAQPQPQDPDPSPVLIESDPGQESSVLALDTAPSSPTQPSRDLQPPPVLPTRPSEATTLEPQREIQISESSSTSNAGSEIEVTREAHGQEGIRREPQSAAVKTMALPHMKHKKQQYGGFKPVDTLTPKPTWLSGNAFKSAASKRTSQDATQVRDPDAPASAYRAFNSHSPTAFPESAAKRQKLERAPSDGLNGQSQSFREMDAMMKPRKTSNASKARSRSLSRNSSQQNSQTSPYYTASAGGTPVVAQDSEYEMLEDEGVSVKQVHSNRRGTLQAQQLPRQVRRAQNEALFNGSEDNDTEDVDAEDLKPIAYSKTRTNGATRRPQHTSNGVLQRNDFGPQPNSDPLTQDDHATNGAPSWLNRGAKSATPSVVINQGPNPPFKSPVRGRQTSPTKQAQAQGHSERLRDTFQRDDSRRTSTDQTDPLQQIVDQIDPGPRSSKLNAQAQLSKAKSTRMAASASYDLRDGFEKDNPHPANKPRTSQARSKGAQTGTKIDFEEGSGIVKKKTMNAEQILDCGVWHEDAKIWDNPVRRNFLYLAGGQEYSIEPTKITKIVWGNARFARFTGSRDKKGLYDVLIKFVDETTFNGFMAACIRLGMRASVAPKDWTTSTDVKLAKVLQKQRDELGVYGREESVILEHRKQNFDRAESISTTTSRSTTKLKDKMRGDDNEGGEGQRSSGRRTGTQRSYDLVARDSRDPKPSRTIQSREPTPPPRIRYSQTGALGKRWKKSLVYPPGASRHNLATVDFDDFERLDDDEFLNDNLIAFGLRRALEKADPKIKDQVHIFNTYFYASLTKNMKNREINYDAVKKWTSRIAKENLFQYNYIIVPINELYHWHVAIICNVNNLSLLPDTADDTASSRPASAADNIPALLSSPRSTRSAVQDERNTSTIERKTSQMSLDDPVLDRREFYVDGIKYDAPSGNEANQPPAMSLRSDNMSSRRKKTGPYDPVIITLDSFGGAHSDVTRALKDYLKQEASEKRQSRLASEPSGLTAKGIPHQHNFSDCGLYMIAYVEQFLKNPEEFVSRVVQREMNEQEHWPDFDATTLRDSCRDIVLAEGQLQNGMNLSYPEKNAIARYGITDNAAAAARAHHASNGDRARRPTPKPERTKEAAPTPQPAESAPQPEASTPQPSSEGGSDDSNDEGPMLYSAFGNSAMTNEQLLDWGKKNMVHHQSQPVESIEAAPASDDLLVPLAEDHASASEGAALPAAEKARKTKSRSNSRARTTRFLATTPLPQGWLNDHPEAEVHFQRAQQQMSRQYDGAGDELPNAADDEPSTATAEAIEPNDERKMNEGEEKMEEDKATDDQTIDEDTQELQTRGHKEPSREL